VQCGDCALLLRHEARGLAVERELFAKDSFKQALARTFVAAGQAPGNNGKFVVYKTHNRNTIAAHLLPEGTAEDTLGSLATIAGDADAATYDDDEEPETEDEAENDDE